jgi:hypothetical protein
MNKAILLLLILCLGALAMLCFHKGSPVTNGNESPGIRIEQIQQLASLTTLHVPIAEVQVYQLQGYTGGIQAAMVLKGDVELATDLTAARLEAVDTGARQLILVLPAPHVARPRLDHERTKIYRIDRSGLWQVVLGDAGESELINRALQDAQQMIAQVGSQRELIEQARCRTNELISSFFHVLGWHVQIQWLDQSAAATRPAAKDDR